MQIIVQSSNLHTTKRVKHTIKKKPGAFFYSDSCSTLTLYDSTMRVHLLVTPMRKKNLEIRPLRLGGFPSHLSTFRRPRTTCTICFTVKSTPIAESSRYLKAANAPPRNASPRQLPSGHLPSGNVSPRKETREQRKGREEEKDGTLHGKLAYPIYREQKTRKKSEPGSGGSLR